MLGGRSFGGGRSLLRARSRLLGRRGRRGRSGSLGGRSRTVAELGLDPVRDRFLQRGRVALHRFADLFEVSQHLLRREAELLGYLVNPWLGHLCSLSHQFLPQLVREAITPERLSQAAGRDRCFDTCRIPAEVGAPPGGPHSGGDDTAGAAADPDQFVLRPLAATTNAGPKRTRVHISPRPLLSRRPRAGALRTPQPAPAVAPLSLRSRCGSGIRT